ncbi:pyridoxamine 5'-phosphate oxidase family protein [Qaidamihabitans albus]|uniref:pyridoxamine 5'-phosphate oxidase family protein n=1 Tax=Qaidamihabitans albus TaxID=2795733 RepID=UPI0018F1A449|nr:pyridoxamine 5'-phosphate oxidase family protein [Qaidamihabitans albus]
MSSTMTADEREAFLAEPHVGVLAVERSGRAPLTVPVWYDYEPGGSVAVLTSPDSVKAKLIRGVGRFTLIAQVAEPPYRYAAADGPAAFDDATYDDVLAMAERYLPREQAVGYAESIRDETNVLIRMTPQRWLSKGQSRLELG